MFHGQDNWDLATINGAITNNTADGLFLLDAEGRVTFLNPAAEALIGWDAPDILGERFDAVLRPVRSEQRDGVQSHLFGRGARVLRNQQGTFTARDGRSIPVSFSNAPIADSRGNVIGSVVSAHDVSDLRAAEEALRRSEARYRGIVDMTVDGIWSFDLDGITTYANARMAEMLGMSVCGLRGKSIFSFVHPADLNVARDLFARWLSGEQLRTEFRFCRCDDTSVYALVSSHASGDSVMGGGEMTVMVSDITELKTAQSQLTAAYNRERRIAETLQRALLKMPLRDAFKNVVVDSVYRTAWSEADVGGDFCDVIGLGRSRVALVVGDVLGKGLPAAAQTAELKFTLRTLLRSTSIPEEALGQLNAILCDPSRDSDDDGIVGLALAVLHTASGDLRIAAAGSEVPAVVNDEGSLTTIDVGGLPLGAEAGSVYESAHLRLRGDETLLMVTDGITEARQGASLFGWDGVAAVLRSGERRKAGRDLLGQILSAATRHAGGRLQDDACLLSARRVD
jgi:PAS domain S-box-containing protein